MRKTIYLALSERLKTSGLGIPHVDLWNNNLEQLTGGKAFRTPAVFVEFEPVEWHQLSMGVRAADLRLRLHIVTKTPATPEAGSKYRARSLAHIDLAESINAVVQGFAGENFSSMTLTGTVPDHNHEQLLHEELHYATHVVDDSAARKFRRTRPAPAVSVEIQKSRRP